MHDGQWVIQTPRGYVVRAFARFFAEDAQYAYAKMLGREWAELEADGYRCVEYRRPRRRAAETGGTHGE